MRFFYNLIYELGRKNVVKDVIPDIGEVIEEEDRFICNARQKDIDKKFRNYNYKFGFSGFYSLDKEMNRMITYYGLKKEVYYIFDGIVFDLPLEFYSTANTYVIFRNCTFKCGIGMLWADDVTFINNKYYDDYSRYIFGKNFIYNMGKMIRKLRFINDNFMNFSFDNNTTGFGMNLDVESLEIIDTRMKIVNDRGVNNSNHGGLNIKADEIKIVNSIIDVDEFYLDAKSMFIDDNSKIKVRVGMIIENSNEDLKTDNIETPYLVYNGVEMIESVGKDIDKEKMALQKGRINFTNVMVAILEKSVIFNEQKINEIRESLENRSLRKVLKR